MTILADENIPCAREAFGRLGQVRVMSGRAITRASLDGVDALVVRSITTVNRDLLEGTRVRFVGTATNGVDHIDTNHLADRNITFAHAGGSNALSVAEYVVAALLELRHRGHILVAGDRLGILGVGEIGSRLALFARSLGMDVVEYDPPRERIDPEFHSASMDQLLACNVISLHIPLVVGGEHPTARLVDAEFLARISPGASLINTARGDVLDTSALIAALRSGRIAAAVLDVWHGEPDIPVDLVEHLAVASPHIAGYAYDAKLRGTEMMASALAAFVGETSPWTMQEVLPRTHGVIHLAIDPAPLDAAATAVRTAYDILRDDADLRASLQLDQAGRRAAFDRLRRDYPMRREFGAWEVAGDATSVTEALGFPPATPPAGPGPQ